MTDRRVNRTKRQIKKALINLLSKKALSRITVSEITELADIGRGTFYTHYQDIYDLYHSLINELAKDVHTGYKMLENTDLKLSVFQHFFILVSY